MTAHRPRHVGPPEDPALIEVLFFGVANPRSSWRVGPGSRTWRPPTDVYETETDLIVQVEIAGARSENFRVALYDRALTITGAREDPHPAPRAYHQMEVRFGEFRVDVDLPGPVDRDNVDATYQNGLLRIILPKRAP